MRCLLGLLPIDEGEIEIFGEPMEEPRGQRVHRIGFVPQTFDPFKWMRVGSYLKFTAAFYLYWNNALETRLIDAWALDRGAKIGQLSEGQRQKLAIIRMMAPEPDLLVLDEPVASLDPQTRAAFLNELIDVVHRYGKTLILSSHITAHRMRMPMRAGRRRCCVRYARAAPTTRCKARSRASTSATCVGVEPRCSGWCSSLYGNLIGVVLNTVLLVGGSMAVFALIVGGGQDGNGAPARVLAYMALFVGRLRCASIGAGFVRMRPHLADLYLAVAPQRNAEFQRRNFDTRATVIPIVAGQTVLGGCCFMPYWATAGRAPCWAL